MKIYIDFDGTLFNTDKYTQDFMKIFHEYGIDNIDFDKVKKKIFNNKRLFNLNKIINYFITEYNINILLKDKIEVLLNNSYLYPEVRNCLDELINDGYELYLLTYGDKEFQNIKIISSNINKYFKDIIITNKNKSELNLDYKNSIFIDNNPNEIEKLYKSMAKNIIRIKRDSDRYAKIKCNILNIIECNNFNQIVQHLKGGFNNE